MGNKHGSLPPAASKKVGKDVTFEKNRMSHEERQLVIRHWPQLMKNNPEMFAEIWRKAVHRSPMIKMTFGVEEGDNPDENASFRRLISAVEAFHHRLIVTYGLEQASVEEACFELGSKHVQYSDRGFQAIYWDIFMVCLTDSVESSIIQEYEAGKRQRELMFAWQKLLRTIVENMRRGYRTQQESQEKPSALHKTQCLAENPYDADS